MNNNSVLNKKQHRKLKRLYYWLVLTHILKKRRVDFMNLGYNGITENLILKKEDLVWEQNPYSLHLYIKLFEGISFSKVRNSLEIGCGLGGGCYLLKEYYHINDVTGIDDNRLSLLYNRLKFKRYGISFKYQNANSLYKLNKNYDLIYSLEASQHFEDWSLFFKNIFSLLSEDGYFLYSDIFKYSSIEYLEKLFYENNLKVLLKVDISTSVIRSIESNSIQFNEQKERRLSFMSKLFNLDGLEPNNASVLYKKLMHKEFVYIKYVISKDK